MMQNGEKWYPPLQKKKNCRFVLHQVIIPLMSTESEEGGKENVYSVSEYLGVNEMEKENVGLSCGSKDRGDDNHKRICRDLVRAWVTKQKQTSQPTHPTYKCTNKLYG